MNHEFNRRSFIAATTAAGVGLTLRRASAAAEKPAILGGARVRTEPFPSWPVTDNRDEKALLDVLRNGKWCRLSGQQVRRFEAAYAELTGAKYCVATANGTSALLASLGALEIGPGDEVIVTPYTFVATINVVLMHHAVPIFVDSDRETFQIDVRKIEAAISERTAAILPVHLGGSAADLDAILAIAEKHKLPVIEDACQAHMGEWRGRKLGTWGATGCFSFQASKNLNSGEGSAILTDDADLAERCYSFHNNGGSRRSGYSGTRSVNLRMTEFQGALLQAQMARLEDQSRTREENAKYLSSMLREIPGISPARMYDGCTRNAYHLYMFRYDRKHFGELRGRNSTTRWRPREFPRRAATVP